MREAIDGTGDISVKYISNMSKQNPLIAIPSDAKIIEAIRELVKNRVHRAVVIQPAADGTNSFVGILSQSTIAAFIASRFGRIAKMNKIASSWPTGDKSIEELGLVKRPVISISSQDNVLFSSYVN